MGSRVSQSVGLKLYFAYSHYKSIMKKSIFLSIVWVFIALSYTQAQDLDEILERAL